MFKNFRVHQNFWFLALAGNFNLFSTDSGLNCIFQSGWIVQAVVDQDSFSR